MDSDTYDLIDCLVTAVRNVSGNLSDITVALNKIEKHLSKLEQIEERLECIEGTLSFAEDFFIMSKANASSSP